MYKFARKLFFLLNPETIHNIIIWVFGRFTFLYPLFRVIYNPGISNQNIKIKNLVFRNSLGLAAGLDKDGEAIRFWDVLGFSHIEVGTVTPLPQPGNPKPRLYRLVEEDALLNRMGFNNKGAISLRNNILKAKKKINSSSFLIGVNIGKNKSTPLENAKDDYCKCIEILSDVADFFTVNISSPNTPGLRELQNEKYFDELLKAISLKNLSLLNKVIFIKIAPDLSQEEVNRIYRTAVKYDIAGIVATNTTISRDGFSDFKDEAGGISGKPLKDKSDNILQYLNELNLASPKKLILIGCGGIFSPSDLRHKLSLGASLVQIYTSFIYEGPGIVKKLLRS